MKKNKISKRISLFTQETADNVSYENYGCSSIQSLINNNETISEEQLDDKAKQIFQWAKKKGALYYTFLCFPRSGGISEKQQTFLNLDYFFKHSSMTSQGNCYFTTSNLLKGQGDGSSFPSGGLRKTCNARAYTIWDIKSDIFFRNRNKTLYIPGLLVSHHGHALDDKTLFRTCEGILSKSVKNLLEKMGIENSGAIMALGLEQQFFVIPREAYLKRIDIRSTGRALVGQLPVKHQQFSDHYYGKMPHEIQNILKEVEDQLLELGVPVKTRHNEVALNQFEFCPLFLQAGKSIDQNMMLMEVLKQAFARRGFEVLLHEKPFQNMNGSGKHHNWSLNYIDGDGKIVNLFKIPKKGEDATLFKLFTLINLAAIANNNKLYMGAIGTNGNELRLGGHQAPPRIISVFLGSAVSNIIDNKQTEDILNFKQNLPNVTYDLYQQNSDRNRTSPYAYTGNKFEFRAAGSSQNPSFIVATIAATVASQVDKVKARLDKGEKLDSIIADLHAKTQNIRFDGNGYSEQWQIEAQKRGLYVNKKFSQILTNLSEASKVFVEIGALEEQETVARSQVMIDSYITCVSTELDAMIQVYDKHIIPRCIDHLNKNVTTKLNSLNRYFNKFETAFDSLLNVKQELNLWQSKGVKNIDDAQKVRDFIWEAGNTVDKVSRFLPRDQGWPQWDQFLLL